MFDWEEGDRFSFEDSDRFEEDSLCSWISEPESLCNNWRGWKKTNGDRTSNQSGLHQSRNREDGAVLSLVELAAKEVACHIPFEVVEHVYPPVPEQLQLRIACWSFPENEEDIRLYSCLANGSADEFIRGEHLFKAKAVKEPLQIGFHLSATVVTPPTVPQNKGTYNVAVTFDRRRVTSCNCTCGTNSWCCHVVSVCLHRIHQSNQVCLRAPVSESLSRLHRDQLQKFAQYLISELPQQILPTAQRLLDELLSCQQSAMNTVCGAPDPTAGASANEQTTWCLDEATLHDNIRKILIKFCVPSPIVFSDVNYLSNTAPPAAAEYTSLLRPLRGREPEGMWNLLSIVREMYRRHDRNAVPLLEILTEECLSCEQILVWWFNTKVLLHSGNNSHSGRGGINSNTNASQHACASLCDEIVVLWRHAALNPALSPQERGILSNRLKDWHMKTIEKVCKARGGNNNGGNGVRKSDIEIFSGFKLAIEACLLDWEDYLIQGVTYSDGISRRYYLPYCSYSKNPDAHLREVVNSSSVVISGEQLSSSCTSVAPNIKLQRSGGVSLHSERRGPNSPHYSREVRIVLAPQTTAANNLSNDGNRSSISSEGFCENEAEGGGGSHDSDSVDEFNGNPAFQNENQTKGLSLQPSSLLSGLSSLTITGKVEASLSVDEFAQIKQQIKSQHAENSSFGSGGAKSNGGVRTLSQLTPSASGGRQFGEKDKSSPDDQDSDWSSAAENGTKATSSRASELRDPTVKFEHSESQQSSDEYQVYYYDTKAKIPAQERPKERKLEDTNVFAGIKRMEDPLDILFARAEALHVHGHTREACKLGVKLAEELLTNPPDLLSELPPQPTKGKRKKKMNPASHQISCLASAVLAKAAFLCTVFSENPDHYHLAFKVGMFGLEMARPPASTKVLEVKLATQESDLVALLKRIPLSQLEMKVIREKAEMLRDGKMTSRGDALLPLNLASFALDVLCPSNALGRALVHPGCRLPSDEILGFEAAVAAMGLKANVSEADHPVLCEGTRRQRGELALTLLVHYKDDQDKLAKIMEKLLDKEIHQMYKVPNLSAYYFSSKMVPSHSMANKFGVNHKEGNGPGVSDDFRRQLAGSSGSANNSSGAPGNLAFNEENIVQEAERTIPGINLNGSRGNQLVNESRAKETGHQNRCSDDRRDDASSPTWEEDYKAWEAKFRCTNFRTHKKHSAGMASIDSSAPETTSSDNSPTLIRRSGWNKPGGPGSDSGSSGKSSDSFGSSSSGDKANRNKSRENECSPQPTFPSNLVRSQKILGGEMVTRSITPCVKNSRFKGKRSYPSVPNQPSEASAHFMFELAKTVLTKAGGTSATSLFTQQSTNQNHRGPHRALHMCAFQVGLYALGLHNCVSPNWLSRTYSSHVSWIASQALEIGSAAITFLIDTWEGHLTPPEVASLADRASRGRDPNMVGTAAELALACLPHAHALNPNEIQRAIMQCKEQNNEMLERACLAVESAAKGGGVYPEVLFDVAHRWYELYKETLPGPDRAQSGEANSSTTHGMEVQHGLGNGASLSADFGLVVGPAVVTSNASMDVNNGIGVSVDTMGFGPNLGQDGQIPLALLNHVPVTSGVAVTVGHSIPYSVPPLSNTVVGMPFAPNLPYNYLPNFSSPYSQPHISLQSPIPLHPYIAAQFPYTNQAAFSLPTQAYYPIPAVTVASQIRTSAPPPPPAYVSQLSAAQSGQQPRPGILLPNQNPLHCIGLQANGHPAQSAAPQGRGSITSISQTQLNYLLSTYRVGMLALETLARRVHDDRPNAKYARTPPYGEDVKWLLNVAKKLGVSYVQQFCICIVNSVVSPFLLQEIILEAALYLAKNNHALLVQHFRSPVLTPLVQKCQQMYIQCTHLKMYHLTPAEYEEFVGIIRSARNAFQMTPGGMVQFNEFLQALRRSKTCKKDLWQRIASGLQAGNV